MSPTRPDRPLIIVSNRGPAQFGRDELGERVIRCRTCDRLIAREDDVFGMAPAGPVALHVNPHGFLHEVLTVREATGLALVGDPTDEDTWFPGYAWTIALKTVA